MSITLKLYPKGRIARFMDCFTQCHAVHLQWTVSIGTRITGTCKN